MYIIHKFIPINACNLYIIVTRFDKKEKTAKQIETKGAEFRKGMTRKMRFCQKTKAGDSPRRWGTRATAFFPPA